MTETGHELRSTFDAEVLCYDQDRPILPSALIDAMLAQGRLERGD